MSNADHPRSQPVALVVAVLMALVVAMLAPVAAAAQVPDDDAPPLQGSILNKPPDTPFDGLAKSLRFAGESRLDTATLIATDATSARATFDGNQLLIARDDVFADALAASLLGGLERSPLILSPRDTAADGGELNASVAAAIAEYEPEQVTILGGVQAIGADVEALLAEEATVRRIAGVNRYETAALVADLAGQVSTAIVANAGDFPDALVSGAIAAGQGFPILLTNSDGPLDPFTAGRLQSLGVDTVILAGGTDALSESVATEIDSIVGDVVRVGGANRFETAVLMAQFATENYDFASAQHVNLARGDDFADALALGPHAGLDFPGPSPILLTAIDQLSAETSDYFATLTSCDFSVLHVAGGPAGISDQVEDQARDILRPEGCLEGLIPPQIVTVTPERSINVVGDDHSVTATVIVDGEPVVGETVTFDILSDGNAQPAPTSATAVTDDAGQATVTFTSASAGLVDVNATSLGAVATASKEFVDTGIIDAGASNCPASPGTGSVANRFCTIQQGVDAAAANPTLDRLTVVPGTYPEDVTVAVDAITIQGSGDTLPIVEGGFVITGADIDVTGLQVQVADGESGFLFDGATGALLIGNTIAGGGSGSRGIATSGAADFIADGNNITDVSTGVAVGAGASAAVTGGSISETGIAVAADTDAPVVVADVTLTGNDQGVALGGSEVTVSGNDFAENPVHVTALVGTYDLNLIVRVNIFDRQRIVGGEIRGD